MKTRVKNIIAALVWTSGVGPLLRFFFEPRLLAIAYHAITDTLGHLNIPPQQFFAQIAYLTRRSYTFVPFRELADNVGNTKKVAIYFDDGFRDMPPLIVPATFFLAIDYLDQKKDGGPYLTWREAKQLTSYGEIGSHSVSHHKLTKMPLAEAREEMTRSKSQLEKGFDVRVTSFSYPYGRNSKELEAIAQKVGYTLTTADKRFSKVRPDPGESLSVFKLKLLGIL